MDVAPLHIGGTVVFNRTLAVALLGPPADYTPTF